MFCVEGIKTWHENPKKYNLQIYLKVASLKTVSQFKSTPPES